MSFTQELSDILHENLCYSTKCAAYAKGEDNEHYQYYYRQAQAVMEILEPEIGAANVVKAARVFLDAFV